LIDYDPRGVIGLVINRPTDVKLSKVLPEIEGLKQRTDMVFMGGPVGRNQMLLLIRSGQHSQETHHVFEDVYASSSMTVLKRMIDEADAEERFRAYIGYAGWSPGQLDREVSRGDWNVWRADAGTIFDKDPSKIWSELIHQSSVEWVKREEPGQNILFFPKRPKIYPIIGYIE
jgi:putative transcriptional regulator